MAQQAPVAGSWSQLKKPGKNEDCPSPRHAHVAVLSRAPGPKGKQPEGAPDLGRPELWVLFGGEDRGLSADVAWKLDLSE